MRLKTIIQGNLFFVFISVFLILNVKLIASSYSDSVEQEEQTVDVEEEDDNFLTSLENSVPGSTTSHKHSPSHILINVKHIVDFIHFMKKSQNQMFRKIETLAKSIQFTDKHKPVGGDEMTFWESRLSSLENRVLGLERSLGKQLPQFGQNQFQQSHSDETFTSRTLPHPSTTKSAQFYTQPTSFISSRTQQRSINVSPGAAGFQIEQPFTPLPLYTTPTFPARNARSRNTSPVQSFFSPVGVSSGTGRLFAPPVPLLHNTPPPQVRGQGQGHVPSSPTISVFTPPNSSSGVRFESEEDIPQPTAAIRRTNENQDMDTVTRKVMELERSVSELRRNVSDSFYSRTRTAPNTETRHISQSTASGIEISALKDKQGQLQRAVDTVMISFSEIFRTLEKVEDKMETCCGAGMTSVTFTTTPPPWTTSSTTLTPLSTRPPYSFPWGSSRTTSYRPPFGGGQTPRGHHSFGFEDDLGHNYDGDMTPISNLPTTTLSTNFADYGRTPEIDLEYDGEWDDSHKSSSNNNDNSWTDHVSAERNEPDPEPIDFATYAFLKRPGSRRRLGTKSLVQRDEGQSRVVRDLSILARRMQNLTIQMGQQREQIHTLSSELTKVNVSHFLLLRTMDDDTITRSIRPRDCSEIQLLRKLQPLHDHDGTTPKNVHNGSQKQTQKTKKATELQPTSSESKGKYVIFPKGADDPVQVICDFGSDGGGWTILQRRGTPVLDGEERTNFFRNWTDYEEGFGSVEGDYWIGLSNIAALTQLDDQELRIELTKWDGDQGVAMYSNFRVGSEALLYPLKVSGYSGNVGDSLSRHNGMAFSTFDSDNDTDLGRNCALEWKGAWWYYGCFESNLNGMYAANPRSNGSHDFGTGIVWQNWTGNYYSLKGIEIKIRNRWRKI